MSKNKKVGEKIRRIRESKGLSLKELALRAALSEEQMNSIENENQLPSLAPLLKIAQVLGVRLGTFLDDADNIGPVVHRHQEDSGKLIFSDEANARQNDLYYHPLAGAKAGRHMEPFVIDIDSSDEGVFALTSHEGEEFLFVLDGVVEVIYGKIRYVLQKGDSIYYDSIVDHNVHAAGVQGAKILAVVYTPL